MTFNDFQDLDRGTLLIPLADAVFAVAQDTKPLSVPEKTMAANLQSYETPPLSKPAAANRCSNTLEVVHVVVDMDGKVSSADYVSGYSNLKDSAVAAVRRWSYKPYTVDGIPVVV